MMQPKEKAYIVVSNRTIREGTVVRRMNGLVLFRFTEGGGIQIPEARVYAAEDDAQKVVDAFRKLHPRIDKTAWLHYRSGNAWRPY